MTPDFEKDLDTVRKVTGEQKMAAGDAERIYEAVTQPEQARWLVPLIGIGLAACAAAALLFTLPSTEVPVPKPAWARAIAPSPCVDIAPDAVRATPTCTSPVEIAIGDERVTLAPQTEIARQGKDIVKLRRGKATFSVRPRHKSNRFKVVASGGVVEVIGTLFTVIERGDSGEVSVEEGVVRFTPGAGEARELAAGDRAVWPAPTPEPTVATPPPPPRKSKPSKLRPHHRPRAAPLSMADVVARLGQLRSQGRYRAAVAFVREVLKRDDLDARQRERFEFELGALTEKMGQPGCDLWRQHLAKYPDGVYRVRVQRKLAKCH